MQTSGVRKNIQVISSEERKQYFWCLKMLSILPPFKANKARYFYTLGTPGPDLKNPFNKIEPLCLYDELISSHSTACEHGSFFFAYYHRHLVFYFQVLLNYVHEVMSGTIQEFQLNFADIYKEGTPELWNKFFTEYHQIAPKKKVMAHYWNPTNYNNRDDLVIPDELSNPKLLQSGYQLDTLDNIFFNVRKHHHYEINAKHRWYNKQGQLLYDTVQRKELIKSFSPPASGDQQGATYYFYKGYTPTNEEQKIISGDLNPRSEQGLPSFLKSFQPFSAFTQENSMPNSMKISSGRNFARFENKQTLNTMNLLAEKEGEILANYGGRLDKAGKAHNMQYLNESQIPNDTTRIDVVNYNSLVPHYQLGYALYNKTLESYINYLDPNFQGLQNPHNTMHNNMHFSMIDGQFSLTNMMFFPYHSWIDVQVEMKIRMCQTPAQANSLFNYLTRLSVRTQQFDPLLNPDSQKQPYGTYPIIQWSDPRFVKYVTSQYTLTFDQKVKLCKQLGLSASDIISAFPAQDYFLVDKSRIRTSKQLGEFYSKNYINQYNKDRLQEFKGFANYDANYDIEIFQTTFEDGKTKNLTGILGQLGSIQHPLYIPQYLKAMEKQVNNQHTFLADFVSKHRSTLQKPRPLKYYTKLVEKGLLMLLSYKSTINNGCYLIYASFQELRKQLQKKKYQMNASKQEFQTLFKKPVCVLTLSIFGKGKNAGNCINCGQSKRKLINMSEKLLTRNKKLWGYVNKLLLKEVVVSSENVQYNEDDNLQVSDIFKFNSKSNQFVFDCIRGAQEVLFDVYFMTDSQKADHFSLTLSLDIVSVQQSKAVGVATKEIVGEQLDFVEFSLTKEQGVFSTHFDFFNLRDSGPLKRNDLDGLIYSTVTLQVFSNNKSFNVSFPIKDYHEVMRYSVMIVDTGDRLTYKVSDADFDFKKKYYESGETSN